MTDSFTAETDRIARAMLTAACERMQCGERTPEMLDPSVWRGYQLLAQSAINAMHNRPAMEPIPNSKERK